MPSPLGHALAGLTVHVLASPQERPLRDLRGALLVVGAALLPDIDLAFRLLDGRNHHNNETHSIGAAALAAAITALALRVLRWTGGGRLSLAVGAGWLSHLVLDYLNRDTNPPIGIMALWPFSNAHHKFPWPIFLDIGRTLEWKTVANNALAAAWETAVLLPLLLIAVRSRSPRR